MLIRCYKFRCREGLRGVAGCYALGEWGLGDVVGVRLACGEGFRGEVLESVVGVGVEWVGMVCVAGVVRGLGIWGRFGHGSGKYPTEPERAGGEGVWLRPPHKFSEFLKTFVLGVTSEVHIIVYTTCTAPQPYT